MFEFSEEFGDDFSNTNFPQKIEFAPQIFLITLCRTPKYHIFAIFDGLNHCNSAMLVDFVHSFFSAEKGVHLARPEVISDLAR